MRGKQRRHRTLYISFLISRLWRSLFGRSRLGPWLDRSRRASESARRAEPRRTDEVGAGARPKARSGDDRRDALDRATPPLRSYDTNPHYRKSTSKRSTLDLVGALDMRTRLSVSSEKRRVRAAVQRRPARRTTAQRPET